MAIDNDIKSLTIDVRFSLRNIGCQSIEQQYLH